jgi:hypothetical protein
MADKKEEIAGFAGMVERTAFRAHELIHRMDHMVYRSWGNVEFLGAIGKEMVK